MKIHEIEQLDESWKSNFASIALMAASLGSIGIAAKNLISPPAAQALNVSINRELTKVGRAAIKELPDVIKNKLGDTNTIIFVKGIPPGGNSKAICQVEQGSRIIYVNPEYEDDFLTGTTDELTAHELTHIAQSNMSKQMQDKFPATDPNNLYGQMTSVDDWKILSSQRKKGERMWNLSREEQAMLVQQRTAQARELNKFINSDRKDKNSPEAVKFINLQKKIIGVYDQYINDYKEN